MNTQITEVALTGALSLSPQVERLLGRKRPPHPDPASFPMRGDLLLQVTLDPSVYNIGDGNERCRGNLALSLYDGVCWRRFDVETLTRMHRFENPAQLSAVELWLRTTVLRHTGRLCCAVEKVEGEKRLTAYCLGAGAADAASASATVPS